MPVTPRTWSAGDPVSPTYLNGDLYAYNYADPLCPNGVQFHARKPVYRSTAASASSITSGTWEFPFTGQMTAHVIEDSCADYGNALDPPQWGTLQCTLPGTDGNAADTGGGWFLLSTFIPVGNASTNGVTFEAGFEVNGSLMNGGGQYAGAQATHSSTPWTCDLVNTLSSDVIVPAAYNGDSATRSTIVNGTGTSTTVYYQGHWATTGGTIVPGQYPPAPKTLWSAGDEWTSAWANGPAGLQDVLEYLNSPPCLRADTGGGTTNCTNSTATVIAVSTIQLDAWGAYNTSTYEWSCPADGLYLIYGRICWNPAAGSFQASIRVNGTDYWGPCNHGAGTLFSTACKAQVFSLQAGDTVQLAGYQTSGSTLATRSDDRSRLVIAWVSSQGVPGVINSNPYFSQGISGWAAFGGTVSAVTSPPAGCPYPQALLFQPNNTQSSASAEENASPFAVTPSDWYGVSSWVQPAGTSQVLLGFDWLTSGHGFISSSHEAVTIPAGTWALPHTIQQAPGSAVLAYPRIGRINGSSTIPSTDTLYIAGVQAAQAGTGQPSPPDLAYRYAAGTSGGSVPAVFSSYLGNDLTFLAQRPYLLAYQSSTQTVANATATQIDMQTVSGQVHGDRGDNYGGWNAADFWYVAQSAGWYLVVFEGFVTANSSANYPGATAQIQVSTGPGPDNYESHVTTSASDGTIPGATAIGYYYLRPGDYVYPLLTISNYPASATTVASGGHVSHFEAVWISE
jgi:hypothetical protein